MDEDRIEELKAFFKSSPDSVADAAREIFLEKIKGIRYDYFVVDEYFVADEGLSGTPKFAEQAREYLYGKMRHPAFVPVDENKFEADSAQLIRETESWLSEYR